MCLRDFIDLGDGKRAQSENHRPRSAGQKRKGILNVIGGAGQDFQVIQFVFVSQIPFAICVIQRIVYDSGRDF
jgi:hypothetical protein